MGKYIAFIYIVCIYIYSISSLFIPLLKYESIICLLQEHLKKKIRIFKQNLFA